MYVSCRKHENIRHWALVETRVTGPLTLVKVSKKTLGARQAVRFHLALGVCTSFRLLD
jgi:hypothetical protein